MNKVILMGRLVKEPDFKETQTGKNVCTFTIAVNRKFNREEADFINCIAWNKTAEFVYKYFNKGDMIALTGYIQTRNYTKDNGEKRYITEINVEEVEFTGKKSNSNETEDIEEGFTPVNNDEDLPF